MAKCTIELLRAVDVTLLTDYYVKLTLKVINWLLCEVNVKGY